MKEILNKLIGHQLLSREESRQVLIEMANGTYNTSQTAAFLTVYMMRSVTTEELEGFRDALLELCHAVDLSDYEPSTFAGPAGTGRTPSTSLLLNVILMFISSSACYSSAMGLPLCRSPNDSNSIV